MASLKCSLEPHVLSKLESLSPSDATIGFLVGRRQLGSRAVVFHTVSCEGDNVQPLSVKGTSVKAHSETLAVVLTSVARTAVGGVSVIGVYAAAPKAAHSAVRAALRTALPDAFFEASVPEPDRLLVLLVDSEAAGRERGRASGKVTGHIWTSDSRGDMPTCPVTQASLLPGFKLYGATFPLAALNGVPEKAILRTAACNTLRAAVRLPQRPLLAIDPGAPGAATTPIGASCVLADPNEPLSNVSERLAAASAADRPLDHKVACLMPCAGAAAGVPGLAQEVAGRLHLSGTLLACAFCQDHETVATLLALLVEDLEASMAARIASNDDAIQDTLFDSERDGAAARRVDGGILLPGGFSVREPGTARLPRRLLARIGETGLPVCEYVSGASQEERDGIFEELAVLFEENVRAASVLESAGSAGAETRVSETHGAMSTVKDSGRATQILLAVLAAAVVLLLVLISQAFAAGSVDTTAEL